MFTNPYLLLDLYDARTADLRAEAARDRLVRVARGASAVRHRRRPHRGGATAGGTIVSEDHACRQEVI